MPALITQTNLAMPKFEKGDAGIILKANGEFVIWNTFENPATPSDHEMEVGRKLMAIAAALRLPQIMDVLHQVANDPNVFSETLHTGEKH